MRKLRILTWVTLLVLVSFLCGCSTTDAVKIGVKLTGKVITDQATDRLGERLMGQPPSAADAEFGAPKKVWKDVNGPRQWRSYGVKFDVLGSKRYVVAVERDRIVRLELLEKHPEKTDYVLEIVYAEKVKGKSPQEVPAALGFGPPRLSARSTVNNQLVQLYDARLVKKLRKSHDAIVWFDEQDRADKVTLVAVASEAE